MEYNITEEYVKQPHMMVEINSVNGGGILNLRKSPTYVIGTPEPEINDLLHIRWTNPFGVDTVGFSINENNPTPHLFYKITDIVSGTLLDNNLVVEVDRELPDFSGLPATINKAGAIAYYNYLTETGGTYNMSATDYVDEAVFSFFENFQLTQIFPFWNMSIIYTEEIVGVQNVNKKYAKFNTNKYGGFLSYIQNQSPTLKKVGVIHYTNESPSNTYGEGLIQNTPKLTIRTIMWHKSPTPKMGLILQAQSGTVKTLTGLTKSLEVKYQDLVDNAGNVVGKVFLDFKLFVIEDQELLFAMSYKSNRSWTLPNYNVGVNMSYVPCPEPTTTTTSTLAPTTTTTTAAPTTTTTTTAAPATTTTTTAAPATTTTTTAAPATTTTTTAAPTTTTTTTLAPTILTFGTQTTTKNVWGDEIDAYRPLVVQNLPSGVKIRPEFHIDFAPNMGGDVQVWVYYSVNSTTTWVEVINWFLVNNDDIYVPFPPVDIGDGDTLRLRLRMLNGPSGAGGTLDSEINGALVTQGSTNISVGTPSEFGLFLIPRS